MHGWIRVRDRPRSIYSVYFAMQVPLPPKFTRNDEIEILKRCGDKGEHIGVHLPCINVNDLFQMSNGPGRTGPRQLGIQKISLSNGTSSSTIAGTGAPPF